MVTVLVSTLNNEENIIKKMNIKGKCIVINQKSNENKTKKMYNETNAEQIWINSTDKGLSKSRNLAIENSNSNISILADDDLVYCSNYEQLIAEAYKMHPNYDIIVFKVESCGFKFKDYPKKKKRIGFLRSMKVSSVQITFKTEKVRNRIKFNEKFGSGAEYLMGEENIFLYDCLRSGLKILYVPQTIAELTYRESTWFKGFDEKYLIDRGASFYAMSQIFHVFLIVQFGLRKRRKFKNNDIGILKALKLMFEGKNRYVEYLRGNTY